jgi:hypothetical protein
LERFSLYVYGGVGGDADVLEVGHVIERMVGMREGLRMYFVPQTEVENVRG